MHRPVAHHNAHEAVMRLIKKTNEEAPDPIDEDIPTMDVQDTEKSDAV